MELLYYFLTLGIFSFFGSCFSSVKKNGSPKPILRRIITALFSGSVTMIVVQLIASRFNIVLNLEAQCSIASIVSFLFDYYKVSEIMSFLKGFKITRR